MKSILYRLRNGKGYATETEEYNSKQKIEAKKALDIVLDSIVDDMNVKNKKIYIPDYINYSLPTTEKQFTGDFPSGTYVSIPKDMIFGIHWENTESRVDLDLSLIFPSGEKIGWDGFYRTGARNMLFSGDITDAPKPQGATELFYVQRQLNKACILFVNYYNFDDNQTEVPFKIIIAKEKPKDFKENYMVNPNNLIAVAKTKINQKQKVLGLLVTTPTECRFYFSETYLGMSITSHNDDFADNARKYLFNFFTNTINFNDILRKAGAKIVANKEEADIDLSPEAIEKDSILKLLMKKGDK